MKGKMSSKGVALGAVGGAISLIMVLLGYYIQNISLTLYVIASVGVMIPLAKNFYKEGFFSVVAVIILGAFFVNIKILPYALVTGTYTFVTLYISNKLKLKIQLVAIIKILYASFVFFILYFVAKLITIDLSAYNLKLDQTVIYILFNCVFVVAFIAYDSLVFFGFDYLKKRLR